MSKEQSLESLNVDSRQFSSRMKLRAPPKVLIGINAWNHFELVQNAHLSHSASEASLMSDFLVLDDASDDSRIQDYFGRLSEKGELLYVRNERNLKLTRSWNRLLHYAVVNGYDYVIQSNSDVIFPRQWLTHFLVHLARGVEFLVPLSNNPGRFSGHKVIHPQDVRAVIPEWKERDDTRATADYAMQCLSTRKMAMPINGGSGFFIGFRTDFLMRVAIREGEYWSESPRYLAANNGVGGDESEIRKRTGVQVFLAGDVYIHHDREYGKPGKSRTSYLSRTKCPEWMQ